MRARGAAPSSRDVARARREARARPLRDGRHGSLDFHCNRARTAALSGGGVGCEVWHLQLWHGNSQSRYGPRAVAAWDHAGYDALKTTAVAPGTLVCACDWGSQGCRAVAMCRGQGLCGARPETPTIPVPSPLGRIAHPYFERLSAVAMCRGQGLCGARPETPTIPVPSPLGRIAQPYFERISADQHERWIRSWRSLAQF